MKKQKTKKSKKEKSLDCPIYDIKGKKVDTISLNSKIFNGEVNIPLLHQVVTIYNAHMRSGSASTKTRSEVRGGGKKPWRQKGTGRARSGSIRSPLWRGGGVIFGPHPRAFSYKLPDKLKKEAIISALNSKFLEDDMVIVNEIRLDQPKTKRFAAVLESLGIKEGTSSIIILDKADNNIKLSSRNIPKLSLRTGNNFNALDILKHKKLIIEEPSLKRLMKELS